MRQLVRKILLVICALTFVVAGAVSFSAAAASAGMPCVHDHQTGSHAHHSGSPSSPSHDHHGAACLACCLGACTAIPDLPPRVASAPMLFPTVPVAYATAAATLDSRMIAPDLGPPRRPI